MTMINDNYVLKCVTIYAMKGGLVLICGGRNGMKNEGRNGMKNDGRKCIRNRILLKKGR